MTICHWKKSCPVFQYVIFICMIGLLISTFLGLRFVPDITSDNKNDMKFTKLSTNQYILSYTKKYYHDYFLMNSWIHTFDRGCNLIWGLITCKFYYWKWSKRGVYGFSSKNEIYMLDHCVEYKLTSIYCLKEISSSQAAYNYSYWFYAGFRYFITSLSLVWILATKNKSHNSF